MLLGDHAHALKALNVPNSSQSKLVLAAEYLTVSRAEMEAVGNKIKAYFSTHHGIENVSLVSTVERPEEVKPERKPVLIAVGSGKGGVGKSTLSVNLALALSRAGIKAGVLDADIYGPSVPMMLGLNGERVAYAEAKLKPSERFGLSVMSIGLMVAPGQAVMWRGPMLIQALKKMISETDWGEVDVVIIDLPPGTGDVQMSLAQNSDLHGAVVVSTPQDVAMADARKAIAMFERLNVPILGVVENMSGFTCPHCSKTSDIFGRDGVKDEAAENGCAFLGQVPLTPWIRENGDRGYSSEDPARDPETCRVFDTIARNLLRQVMAESHLND